MRVAVVVALIALASASPAFYPGLTADQRSAIETTNQHSLEKLDWTTHVRGTKFLAAVKTADSVIRLGHAIKGGHSIMYEFVEGPAGAAARIGSLATANGINVVPSSSCKCKQCCGRIVFPGKGVNIVSADEVAGNRQDRKGNTTASPVEPLKPLNTTTAHEQTVQEMQDKARTKIFKLTPDQKQWYHDNNLAQISKMNAEAQPFIRKFAEDLRSKAPNTVVHFMEPIRNGYTVRFTHVEGPLGPVRKWASQCGLVLKGRTLTAPKGDAHNAETVNTQHSHIEAETPDQEKNGVPKPLVHAPLERVPELPKKWIETKPALLEEDDSLMELFAEADRAADVLSDAEDF